MATTRQVDSGNFTAGAVDAVISSVVTEPKEPQSGELFSVHVRGWAIPHHVPSQRIKIMREEDGCDGTQPAAVVGLGCSDTFICSPKPASASSTEVVFSGIAIIATSATQVYKICYCGGPCHQPWHFAEVPGSEVTMMPARFTFSVEASNTVTPNGNAKALFSSPGVLSPNLNRKTGDFALRVDRRAFYTYSDPTQWLLKIVKGNFHPEAGGMAAQDHCNAIGPSDVFDNKQYNTGTADPGDSSTLLTREELYDLPDRRTTAAGDLFDLPNQTWCPCSTTCDTPVAAALLLQNSSAVCLSTPASAVWYSCGADGVVSVAEASGAGCVDAGAAPPAAGVPVGREEAAAALQGQCRPGQSFTLKHALPQYVMPWCLRSQPLSEPLRRLQNHPTNAWEVARTSKDQATWEVSIDSNDDEATGQYLVCLCEERVLPGFQSQHAGNQGEEPAGLTCGSRWVPVPDTMGHLHLQVMPHAEDLAPMAGPHTGQRWSRRLARHPGNSRWTGTFTLSLEGYKLGDAQLTSLGIYAPGTDCNTRTNGGWSPIVDGTRGTVEDDSTDFTFALGGTGVNGFGGYSYQVCLRTGAHNPVAVGRLHVTGRPHVDRTFVLDTEVDQSIEITGENLDWRRDRIMVVDCQASCGASGPAAAVQVPRSPDGDHPVDVWSRLAPVLQGTGDPWAVTEDKPAVMEQFTTIDRRFCVGNNIAISPLDPNFGFACSGRCAAGTVEGCSGYMPAYDDDNLGRALCIPRAQCEAACASTEGCYGIDMHRVVDRCYLNMRHCQHQVETGILGIDPSYDFLVRKDAGEAHVTLEPTATTTVDASSTTTKVLWSDGRRLHGTEGMEVSTTTVLRFAPVRLASLGTYKVCFCDYQSFAATGQTACESEADYALEIGTIHVSGVSCLLTQANLRKQTCRTMAYGGLQCGTSLPDQTAAPAGFTPGPRPMARDDTEEMQG